jgi:hypothetical protein
MPSLTGDDGGEVADALQTEWICLRGTKGAKRDETRGLQDASAE